MTQQSAEANPRLRMIWSQNQSVGDFVPRTVNGDAFGTPSLLDCGPTVRKASSIPEPASRAAGEG